MNISTKKRFDQIVKSARKKSLGIQENCQYLQNDKERFCRASTNTSCSGCKFFDPKFSVKAELFVDAMIASEEKAKKERAGLVAMYEKKVEELRDAVTFYRTCGTEQ